MTATAPRLNKMFIRFTLTADAARALLSRMASDNGATALCYPGLNRNAGTTEYLISSFSWDFGPPNGSGPSILMRGSSNTRDFEDRLIWTSGTFDSGIDAELLFGFGSALGRVAVLIRGRHEPVSLRVVGAGIPIIGLRARQTPGELIVDATDGAWSRTVGALGSDTWQRLSGQTFALVGCGRTGSIAAASLARITYRRPSSFDQSLPTQLGPLRQHCDCRTRSRRRRAWCAL
jgi:hypothetical protein